MIYMVNQLMRYIPILFVQLLLYSICVSDTLKHGKYFNQIFTAFKSINFSNLSSNEY